MDLRRIIIVAGVVLCFFLGVYSWNQSTHVLDDFATNVGLEIGGAVLRPVRFIEDHINSVWVHYFELIGVREENDKLKERIDQLEKRLAENAEKLAELSRLRTLINLPKDPSWRHLGARVLAGRIGPNALRDSIMIGRGYANGAKPGIPVITNKGLIGRVLRASAYTSTAILLTDPSSCVSVYAQKSRAKGILRGQGLGKALEMDYVTRDSAVAPNDILVTSGLDGLYPKGIPVARVITVAPSDYTEFLAVSAVSLANMSHLEEVILLEPAAGSINKGSSFGKNQSFIGPLLPDATEAP